MDLRRLEGDATEADSFSWDELLAEPASEAPAPKPRVRGLRRGLSAIATFSLALSLLLASEHRDTLPSLEALQSPDPSVDVQLLRLHEQLLASTDEESQRLRLRCALWLRRRAAQ